MSAGEAHKPPPYYAVWVGLLALTIAEFFFAFVSTIPKVWIVIGLMAMAFLKAFMVAVYYMHLKWEPKRLWLLAAAPIPLVMILIFVVLNEIF